MQQAKLSTHAKTTGTLTEILLLDKKAQWQEQLARRMHCKIALALVIK